MQIPVLSGIYTDEVGQYRTSYPRNLVPVPKESGISNGYLRHADGIIYVSDGPGIDRGGIEWGGILYRVMGTKFVSILEDGTVTTIGDVGGTTQVTFVYSFDYLAIASNGNLWLYDGTTLAQVTDADLGAVIDVTWIDGYFVTTDRTFLVVTELNNPFAVNPLKYGSSESNPDPVLAVANVRNELVALNRNTIEYFYNIGGSYFPFKRIIGAQINKGIVGTHAFSVVENMIMFVGSGKNEAVSVYSGANGNATKIATSEIDQILAKYTEAQLSTIVCEQRIYDGHIHFMIHLPDKCLVLDMSATAYIGKKIWFTLDSGLMESMEYRAKNLVHCYNRWNVGDPTSTKQGYLSNATSYHFGDRVYWEFSTTIVYNEGMGVIFHSLELVANTGRFNSDYTPTVSTQYTLDGLTWSQERFINSGGIGDRDKRIVWFLQGSMRNWRAQRFRGTSDAMISISRLEAKIEPLAV